MSLKFESGDHAGQPAPAPPPGLPKVRPADVQKFIAQQMEAGVKAGTVSGWACSVSNADGSAPHHAAGGIARKTLFPRETVPMRRELQTMIGSCSKTVTAAAAMAAWWAVRTNFGASPVNGATLRNEAVILPLATFLPRDWNTSAVDGTGRFPIAPGNPLVSLNQGGPQPTAITFTHLLRHQSYLQRELTTAYHSAHPSYLDGGEYRNVRKNIEFGPVLKKATNKIGIGSGQYSNQGHSVFRVAIPYLLGGGTVSPSRGAPPGLPQVPGLPGFPTPAQLDAMDRPLRDITTAAIFEQFVQDHVLKPCGVTKASLDPGKDVCYFAPLTPAQATISDFVDETDEESGGLDHFEWCERDSFFLTSGATGWHMSADELRTFLVGLQAGAPFKNDASWWTDLFLPLQFGIDGPWRSAKLKKLANIQLGGGVFMPNLHKNGGDTFVWWDAPGLPGATAGAQWMITADGITAVIVRNGKSLNSPNLLTVLQASYASAFAAAAFRRAS